MTNDIVIKQVVREAATICPRPCKLTLKMLSESRVTWATYVPILFFLRISSRLSRDVRDRQTSDSINAPAYGARGIVTLAEVVIVS